jgi:osmoprotectant transport system substrate-binding protein
VDRKQILVLAGCVLAGTLALSSCREEVRKVRVGSKNFSESIFLAECVAQLLEARGVPVDRRLNLGGTMLAHEALLAGELDVYPEYSGTALSEILKVDPEPDASIARTRLKQDYPRQRLEWLDPLGFENSFVMVIRQNDTRAANLRTLSDAAVDAKGWRMGFGYEFEQRRDGLKGLLRVYSIQYSAPPRTMDLNLVYKALLDGQVDLVAGNATDGILSNGSFKVLEDDKKLFPSYEAALVARQDALAEFKTLRSVLAELNGRFPVVRMQQINKLIDVDRKVASVVAQEYLRELKLIR